MRGTMRKIATSMKDRDRGERKLHSMRSLKRVVVECVASEVNIIWAMEVLNPSKRRKAPIDEDGQEEEEPGCLKMLVEKSNVVDKWKTIFF